MCLHLFLYIFRLGGVFLSTSTRCLGRQLPDKRDSPVAESSVKMQDQEEVHLSQRGPLCFPQPLPVLFLEVFPV